MDIPLKSDQEIATMRLGGRKLASVMAQLLEKTKPGVTTAELDQTADRLIKKAGGKPSFKMVKNYHWATCININDGVVHGIPNDYRIKPDDLVSLDVGIYYQGFHTDMAWSVYLGNNPDKRQFLRSGETTLNRAIAAARPGSRLGSISKAIESSLRKTGLNPVVELTGHGVGRSLHEEPMIPGWLKRKISSTPLLQPGMVLAIEIIYTQGQPRISLSSDGWTFTTHDHSLAGLFEKTIAVTPTGPLLIT